MTRIGDMPTETGNEAMVDIRGGKVITQDDFHEVRSRML